MTPRRRRTPFLFGVLLITLSIIWAVFVSRPTVLAIASPFDRLESALLDARYASFGPIAPSPDVVVVAIDDATLDEVRDRFPDNRLLLAGVIRQIAAAAPKVLGLDVLLADTGDPEIDRQLAAALSQTDAVIAAAGRFPDDLGAADPSRPGRVIRPQDGFLRVATSGLVNLSTDAGGTPRYLPILFRTSQGLEPAFALHIASKFNSASPTIETTNLALGSKMIPLDVGLNMPLRLAGPTGTIPTYSARDLLSGQIKEELAGKAVILGFTATAFGDRFPNPFDENVPGAEIIATAVSQILGAPSLRRDAVTRRVDAAAGIALAVLTTFLVIVLPLSVGIPLAVAGLAVWMGVVWYAFSIGIWLSGSIPLVCAIVTILTGASWRYFGERRSAARGAQALAALKQFQSPALAEMIANDPAFLKHPTEQRLSVFFVDLSSFTNLSEKLGPAGTQDLLKQFHQLTARTIEANGGIVLNFMGDGALAIFGMTTQASRGADDAMQAAFGLVQDIERLGPDLAQGQYVGCRIGLHHGDVILSRLGGDQHHQVSVAGDTVNLASRLLEITKEEGATIAATDAVLSIATHNAEPAPAFVKPVAVRGRESDALVHFWT
ncbi:MAG: adenylate/guanylate cyclase domain-containing protein [Paracoccaceae bacterium]|nr:adenylate/guanylate cyclase domain-containing protein [Paracoccaceae bacterium]